MACAECREENCADQEGITRGTYPACGNADYAFKERRKGAAEPGKERRVETLYECMARSCQWKVRDPE
jgi:hypothetical protein